MKPGNIGKLLWVWRYKDRLSMACLLILSTLIILPVSTWGGTGTSGASVLRQSSSARVVGMGEAYTAVAENVYTLQYNPAGLAVIEQAEISALYVKGLDDVYYGYLGLAYPFDGGAAAASLLTLQGGMIEINEEDGTSETLNAQQDYVFCIGGGWEIISLPKGLMVGAVFKVIHSVLVEQYRALAFAVDIGVYYPTPIKGLTVGVSFQNIGTELKYLEATDPLPFIARAGVGYKIDFQNDNYLQMAADLLNEDKLHLGVEYGFNNSAWVRLGYKIGYSLESLTCGLGLGIEKLRVDYALGLMGDLGLKHLVSVTFIF